MRKNPFHSYRVAITVTIFMFFISINNVSGAPAYPYPIDVEQPDGSVITVQLHGDEWVSWQTTLDDYTMLVNGEGELEYAVLDGYGDLQPSGVRARNERERTDEEKRFLQKHSKNLRYSASQINVMRQIRAVRDDAQEEIQEAPIQGTIRTPVILVAFKNKPFQKTKEQFESLFNQLNYTDNGRIPGSMNDFFKQNSYGKFDLQADVYGPYTMSQEVSYYDHKGSGGNGAGPKMAVEAVRAAIADGLKLSKYPDPANSANAIAVHIIYAGYGQEAGAPVGTAIWAHASSFAAITDDGKRISRYSCSPELRNKSGTTITNIGVIAHELGHSVLGLPDFYDANYETDGTSVDIGPWCLMAGGMWNGSGDRPSFLSAESRVTVGWSTSTLLDTPQSVTLPDPSTLSQQVVYRINTATNNEYFLLENRQRVGWENGSIPASGMIIYHVDKAGVTWSRGVNTNANRRGYYVKQAGCAAANGCPATNALPRSNDAFPRATYNSFTDASTPNSKSYAGVNTNKPVTDITHNTSARTVSFNFMGGGATINYFTVTFDANGGTVSPATAMTAADGKLTSLPTPTRTGYTFSGWFTAATGGSAVNANTVFQQNTTVYAQWAVNTYTITFNVNGNGGTVSPATAATGADGKLASLPTPVRAGFTFNGWYTAASGGTAVNTNTVFTRNTTIYARWTASTYTVTFFDYNGVQLRRQTVNYNIKITAPQNPTREGYVFDGWYDGDTLFDFNTPITRNMELTAKYTAEVSTGVPAKSDSRCGIRFKNSVVSDKLEIERVILPIFGSDKTESAKEIKVVIYDNAGNVVFATTQAGEKAVWNLTNNAGRTVANGAYLVIVEAKGKSGKVYSYYDKIGVNVKK